MFDDLRLERREGPVRRHADGRPVSATASWINLTGLACFLAALWLVQWWRVDQTWTLVVLMAAIALPIALLEVVFLNGLPGRVAPPGTPFFSRRAVIKIAGLAATLAVLALLYWLLPVYRAGEARVLLALAGFPWVWAPFCIAAPFYVAWMDRRMSAPEDGLYHAGLVATGQWERAGRRQVWQHALGWLVKGFFLPLMLAFAMENLAWWQAIWWPDHLPPDAGPGHYLAGPGYFALFEILFKLTFFVDVAFAAAGYVLTLRVFDSHIRTSEPTWFGWAVCVICYPPFWTGVFSASYFAYDADGLAWGAWFGHYPVVAHIWALAILILVGIYAWATVQFGIRFSNLTNRGILTDGPYRWSKHPAYIAKNLSWWLISVPFLSEAGVAEAVRLSLLLLAVNGLYYLRAKTEERHLMTDPVYRAYAAWIARHGLFARLGRRRRASARVQ